MGAPLARQELNLGFATLLRRTKNLSLDLDKPPPEPVPAIIMRQIEHVHVRFDWR